MAYLGNDLQVAFPTYRNIDDISGSFNGVTTSFPLTVDGVAPIPAPVNSQQCLISVNGVVQRPDDSGAEGFLLSGGNIVFASAPAGGVDFFGVILAGADYINIGANFPSGTALVPSITFDSDLDTGIYNPAGNQIGFTTAGVQRLVINSSGQVSGGLGSATTPAFSFLSDPNTGIYSPGADQVAVATNGVGRLFVDANGNVGVGASPTTNNAITFPNNGSLAFAGPIGQLNTNSSFSSGSERYITSAEAARYYQISGEHIWQTAAAGTAGNTISFSERLRITSAGLVGIGTSSPIGLLQLKYATNVNTSFRNSSAAGLTAGTLVEAVNDGFSAFTPYYIRASEYGFGTDSGGTYVPRFTIDSSGNVGIGTTTVSAKLHIAGATGGGVAGIWDTAAGGARIEYKDNGTRRGLLNWDTNSLLLAADYGNSIKFSTNAGVTQHATIDSSGRLGIGTSAPSAPLHVARSGAGVGLQVQNTSTYSQIEITSGGTDSNAYFTFSPTGTGKGIIQIGGSDKIAIDSSGRVGIGTTSADQLLVVSQNAASYNPAIKISNPNTGRWGGKLIFESATGAGVYDAAVIKADGGGGFGGGNLIVETAGSERCRVDGSGRLLVGTSSARSNVYIAGNSTTPLIQSETSGNTYNNGDSLLTYSSVNYAPILTLGTSNSDTAGTNAALGLNYALGFINFVGNDGTNFRSGAWISAAVDGSVSTGDLPTRLSFSTTADGASTPTERMRISNDGSTNHYTNHTNVHIARSGNAAGTTDSIYVGARSATNTTNGTVVYRVYTNGTYATISDANQKKNVETTRDGYLDDLNKLRVVKYNWNEQEDTDPKELGLIAQEVEQVFPGLVTQIADDTEEQQYKGIKTSVLPFMLLKALQEASAKIEVLEAEVAALKAQ